MPLLDNSKTNFVSSVQCTVHCAEFERTSTIENKLVKFKQTPPPWPSLFWAVLSSVPTYDGTTVWRRLTSGSHLLDLQSIVKYMNYLCVSNKSAIPVQKLWVVISCQIFWKKNDLDLITHVRWQAYNGASNMCCRYSVVKTRILHRNKRTLYVHCCNQRLNLYRPTIRYYTPDRFVCDWDISKIVS